MLRLLLLLHLLSGLVLAETNIMIRHVPLTKFGYPGRPVTFRAVMVPVNCTITSATLMYRVQGEQEYTRFIAFSTNRSATNYQAFLTNCQETKNSLEYRIKAEDNFHNKRMVPENTAYNLEILPREEGRISPSEEGCIILPDDIPDDDRVTSLVLPANSLYQEEYFGIEYYSGDTVGPYMDLNGLTVRDNPFIRDNSLPVVLYRFYQKAGEEKNDFSFRKKAVISLRYFPDGNFSDEEKLDAFFWDGKEWRYVPGSRDTVNDVLVLEPDHIGLFGIFEKGKDEAVSLAAKILDYVSRPSFAPRNGEIVVFGIKTGITDYRIRILDPGARLIRELRTASWDGRDRDGNYARSGVYIYQITAGNKTISGMICVVK
ncbi:MAG: hypothetical protein PHF84_02460 [bacterium]|nr:hypothetical protein [bacterium]